MPMNTRATGATDRATKSYPDLSQIRTIDPMNEQRPPQFGLGVLLLWVTLIVGLVEFLKFMDCPSVLSGLIVVWIAFLGILQLLVPCSKSADLSGALGACFGFLAGLSTQPWNYSLAGSVGIPIIAAGIGSAASSMLWALLVVVLACLRRVVERSH